MNEQRKKTERKYTKSEIRKQSNFLNRKQKKVYHRFQKYCRNYLRSNESIQKLKLIKLKKKQVNIFFLKNQNKKRKCYRR